MTNYPVTRSASVVMVQRSVAIYGMKKTPSLPPAQQSTSSSSSSYRPYTPPPKKPMGFAQIVVLIILIGMILLVTIFMLRQPIDNMAQAHADDKKKKLMEAKAKLDYETLASEIRIGLELTTRRLNYLENNIHRLQTKTQAILGVPMEELVSFPRKRPRDLDMAILKSDTFARNWSGLVNAHIFPVDVELNFVTLEYIRTRLETETLRPEDKNTLTRLGYWSATRQEFTQHQIRNLRELAEILQMNQLYENLKKIEERSLQNENSDYKQL